MFFFTSCDYEEQGYLLLQNHSLMQELHACVTLRDRQKLKESLLIKALSRALENIQHTISIFPHNELRSL